jgi:hypothetical protein
MALDGKSGIAERTARGVDTHDPSMTSRRHSATLFSLAVAALGAVACSKHDGGSGAGAGCVPVWAEGDAGVPAYDTFASGTAAAPGMNASFCNAGISLQQNGLQPPAILQLETQDAYTAVSVTVSGTSARALGGMLSATFAVPPAVGVYKSTDSDACGSVLLGYGLPSAPGVDCSTAPGNACPQGCQQTFACGAHSDGTGCCLTVATMFEYQSNASTSTCTRGVVNGPALGSWTLTLSSVTAYADSTKYLGPDGTAFFAHGTLTAELAGTADTKDSATLTLTF